MPLTDTVDRISQRATTAAVLWAVLPPLLVGLAAVLTGRSFSGVDTLRSDVGLACALRQLLADGDTWVSPLVGAGLPVGVDPQAQLFFPLRWLALAWSPEKGAAVEQAVLWAAAAGAGAFLVRTFGAGVRDAALMGWALALSGTVLDLPAHAAFLCGALGLPLAWGATRRLLSRRARPVHAVWLAVALLTLLTGTDPQVLGECALLALLEVGRRRAWRAGAHVGLVFAGCLLLGMLVWLPALGEMALTARSGGFDAQSALRWALEPSLVPALVVPGWVPLVWAHVDTSAEPALPWTASFHVGGLALGWALLSLRRSGVAGVFTALSLLAALGPHTPVYPLMLRLLPPLQAFRYPAKYLLPFTVGLLVMTLLGTRTLSARFRRLGAALVPAGLALAAWAFLTVATDTWTEQALVRSVGLGALLQVALLGGLLAPRRWRVPVVVVSLVAGVPATVTLVPAVAQTSAALAKLPAAASGDGTVLCHARDLAGLSFGGDNTALGQAVLMSVVGVPNLNACADARAAVPYSLLQSRVNAQLADALPDVRAARAMGCTHLITSRPPPGAFAVTVRLGHRASPVVALSLPDVQPDATLVSAPRLVPGPALLRALLDAANARDAMGVLDDPRDRLAGAPLPPVEGGRVARWLRLSAEHHRFVLEGSGPRLLVVKTAFAVGWSAAQEDAPLTVLRSSGSHVAVLVPNAAAGPVDITYAPPHQRLSWVLAGLGVLLLVLAARMGPRRGLSP